MSKAADEFKVNNFETQRSSIVVVLTVGAAFLSWRLVERPFLQRKKQAMHAVTAGAGHAG